MKKTHLNISEKALQVKEKCRGRLDLLRSRVNLLTGQDKLLMTMYLEKGISFRQIARLAGINEAIVSRRIHKLTERLIDGQYITCLRNRNKFTKTEMAVAKDYFLTGLSIKKVATKQKWTYYRVHKILKRIQQLVTTIQNKPEEF